MLHSLVLKKYHVPFSTYYISHTVSVLFNEYSLDNHWTRGSSQDARPRLSRSDSALPPLFWERERKRERASEQIRLSSGNSSSASGGSSVKASARLRTALSRANHSLSPVTDWDLTAALDLNEPSTSSSTSRRQPPFAWLPVPFISTQFLEFLMENGDVCSALQSVLRPLRPNCAALQRLLTGNGDAPLSSALHVSSSRSASAERVFRARFTASQFRETHEISPLTRQFVFYF